MMSCKYSKLIRNVPELLLNTSLTKFLKPLVSNTFVSSKFLHNFSSHRNYYSSGDVKLTPQEVDKILRANEYTHDFNGGSVKSYDSNQLASNNPIEDTRAEASCLVTSGVLVGVFDGHGGGACAQVIAKRLYQYITACLLPHDQLIKYISTHDSASNPMHLLESYNNKVQLVDDVKEIYKKSFRRFLDNLVKEGYLDGFAMETALEKAFLSLDDDLSREGLPKEGEEVNRKTLSVAMSGAVACVAHIDGPHLHIASVGDCAAVLVRELATSGKQEFQVGQFLDMLSLTLLDVIRAVWLAVGVAFISAHRSCIGSLSETNSWIANKLTVEHNIDNSSEVERILSEHPPTERRTAIQMGRLLGRLAPFRAMGDFSYKWSKQALTQHVAKYLGPETVPKNYHTPPYLTAKPDVSHYRLTPRDKFLIIASDGLWDVISPLQAVRLVGEHMKGKVTLSPLKLPRKRMTLGDINEILLQRKEGMKTKPKDTNASTHLIRNALGGTDYGIDNNELSKMLTLPGEVVRLFRDDITVTVVYFDSEFLRHCPA